MNIQSAQEAQQVLRWLVIVRWVALADLLLLIVLLAASVADNEMMVRVFGLTPRTGFPGPPSHGSYRRSPKTLELVVSNRHTCYDWPSGSFYRGIPDRAKSQSHPRHSDRGRR